MDEEIRINSVGADGIRGMKDARDLRSFESKHRGNRLTDARVSGKESGPKDFITILQYSITGIFHDQKGDLLLQLGMFWFREKSSKMTRPKGVIGRTSKVIEGISDLVRKFGTKGGKDSSACFRDRCG